MQIREIRLTNAFSHKSLIVPLAPFTSIVGANGSGKSTLLEAAALALTGVMLLPGKLESAIRDGEEKGKVELTIESEGEIIELVAHLGKSSRSLTRGNLKLNKNAEVLEYLEKTVLRTSFNVVNSSSIIRQGSLDAGLFDTPARRSDAFIRMAGLSDIEKKRQLLADTRASVTVPMLSFSVSEAEKKVAELHEYIEKVQDERSMLILAPDIDIKAAQTLVANTDQAEELKATMGQLTKEHGEACQMHSTAATSVDTHKKSIAALEADEEKYRDAGVKAAAELQNLAKAQQDWNTKVACQAQISAINLKCQNLKEVSAEFAGTDPQQLCEILTEITVKMQGVQHTVEEFSKEVSVCPTCRRCCTKLESESILKDAQAELDEMTKLRAETKEVWSKSLSEKTAWESALSTYKTTLTSLLSQLETAEAKLGMVKDAEAPVSSASAKTVADTYRATLAKLKTARAALPAAEALAVDAAALVNDLAIKLAKAGSKAASGITKTSIEYITAKKLLADTEQTKKKAVELETIGKETAKRLEEELKKLDKLKADVEKSKTLVAFTDHLEFARTALHRDNFPSGRVKAFVDRMLINANVYLDAMEAGFSVSYDNETGFIAFFPGSNKRMRADRLSGGERVTFALAFRFAVNELHTDTGFLILDEPTVWLDDKHIDYVINALALVKSKIVPRVQLIIVTHDEKLAAVADSVFEVRKQ